jgi:hypothetical protein
MLRSHAHRLKQLNAGNAGGARAIDDEFGIAQIPTR